jgi:hypothetical protein
MPRLYAVTQENVTLSTSAAADILQINGAAGKSVRLKRVRAAAPDSTAPTSQQIGWRMRYFPVTVTNGGGATLTTLGRADPGDAAATFTALGYSTTKATTTGTPIIFYEGADHVFNGLDETFDGIVMRAPPLVGAGVAIVIEQLAAVSGVVHLNVTAEVEEEG